jgi:hypothetical protein
MSEAELETFPLRIALPPLRLGLYVKRLTARKIVSVPQPYTASYAALNDSAFGWRSRDGGIEQLEATPCLNAVGAAALRVP